MAEKNAYELVQQAFPEHCTQIVEVIGGQRMPNDLWKVFSDISEYVLSTKQHPDPQSQANHKKRKLEEEPENNHVVPNKVPPVKQGLPLFECSDVSVQVPVRKKMKIEIEGFLGDDRNVILINQSSGLVEHSLLASEVDEVFCLPTPDKQVRQANFILFPKPGASGRSGRQVDQIAFVMNDTPATAGAFNPHGIKDEQKQDDTFITVTQRALDVWLNKYHKRVVTPDANEFASSITQSHRKGEKAYHVRAHRGSKEGYLFFLSNGIVFGFKKPLAFFPFSSIDSISYTSVLQRTFNLVIAAREHDAEEAKEIEFSMLDQEDFVGIDTYIKKHGLNDASMAAQRRAKAYNVNKEKKAEGGEAANGAMEEDDGQSELQKAEQQLQDEEDELEEDYEVSGGESGGEGEESEEEEEGYDEEVDEVDGENED